MSTQAYLDFIDRISAIPAPPSLAPLRLLSDAESEALCRRTHDIMTGAPAIQELPVAAPPPVCLLSDAESEALYQLAHDIMTGAPAIQDLPVSLLSDTQSESLYQATQDILMGITRIKCVPNGMEDLVLKV